MTFSASIANLIDQERIQKAMSFNQMSVSIATIGGPAVGGLLFGLVSMPLFLVIHMLGYAVAVILEATMDFKLFTKKTDEVLEEDKETMIQSIKAGIHYLKQHRVLTVIIWVALAINFLFGAFEIGFSYILVEELNIKSIHFGFTEGALSVGVLAASIFLSTRKDMKFPLVTSKRGIMIMGILMASVGLPLIVTLSYFGIVSFYMILMFVFGLTIVFVNTPIGVMMQKRIDEEYRGRVFGILETMSMALTPLGMVVFGLLYDIVPAHWVLFGSSTILLVTVLYMLRPSIMKEAHPELGEKALVKEAVEITS